MFVYVSGATAQRGPGPPHVQGFYITHNDTPQPVGLLWTGDRPVGETCTSQQAMLKETDIHPPSGIRTSNSSKQAAVDPRLWALGQCDLLLIRYFDWFLYKTYNVVAGTVSTKFTGCVPEFCITTRIFVSNLRELFLIPYESMLRYISWPNFIRLTPIVRQSLPWPV